MKLLILPAVLFCCISAYSQIDKTPIPGIQPKFPLYHYEQKQNSIIYPYSKTISTVPNLYSFSRSFGGTVYLPQDNMPCIIPPASTLGSIPNFWNLQLFPATGTMPNPAQPLDINQLPMLNRGTGIEQTIPIK